MIASLTNPQRVLKPSIGIMYFTHHPHCITHQPAEGTETDHTHPLALKIIIALLTNPQRVLKLRKRHSFG
jgi:hypothetical protein